MFAFVMRLLTASALLLTPVAGYITPPLAEDGLVAVGLVRVRVRVGACAGG